MTQVVVVGGGVTGAFCAYYLAREGADVTLVEQGELCSGSIHAAGLIEPANYYTINNWGYLRDALSFALRGVLRLRRVAASWLLSYLAGFGEKLGPDDVELLSKMAEHSASEYRRLGEEDPAWGYTQPGLLELYEEERSLEGALRALKARGGWRLAECEGYAGGIVYEDVGVVVTEKFAQRMGEELRALGVNVLRKRAGRVWLDGKVEVGGKTLIPEKTIVAAGVECRRLGVPITGVGGVGYRFRPASPDRKPERPILVYERTLAVVWAGGWVKATLGLDFSFKPTTPSVESVERLVKRFVEVSGLIDVRTGVRPCSPDGLPVVGGRGGLVVATGGFRLGWSLAPAIAKAAVDIALGRARNHPRLSRYARGLRSGSLG